MKTFAIISIIWFMTSALFGQDTCTIDFKYLGDSNRREWDECNTHFRLSKGIITNFYFDTINDPNDTSAWSVAPLMGDNLMSSRYFHLDSFWLDLAYNLEEDTLVSIIFEGYNGNKLVSSDSFNISKSDGINDFTDFFVVDEKWDSINRIYIYNSSQKYNFIDMKIDELHVKFCDTTITTESALPNTNIDDISASPNPFRNSYKLNVKKNELQNLVITDVYGKSVPFSYNNGFQNVSINLSNLPDGVYINYLYINDGIKKIKVIKSDDGL